MPMNRSIGAASVLLFFAAVFLIEAQESGKPAEPQAAPAAQPMPLPTAIKELADAKRIDADALADAWGAQNAVALAEMAVGLKKAEQAGGKANPTVSASKMFDAAVRTAAAKRDAAALEKILAIPAVSQDADWKSQIETTLRLTKATRAADPALALTEANSHETNLQLRLYADAIENAKGRNDAGVLKELSASLPGNTHLDAKRQASLKKLIDETAAAMPKDDALAGMLNQLGSASRSAPVAQAGVVALDFSNTPISISVPKNSGLASNAATPSNPISAGQVAIQTAPAAAPKTSVRFTILNKVTQYNVAFDLVSPDGRNTTCYIRPNLLGTYTITYTSGRGTPAIKIWQVGGRAPLSFSVANNGNYQFQMGSDKLIRNYYR
jgi:hypothetical protein